MVTFLTIFYVFVCLFLITVVMLQAGKGGGMGSAFGGTSQSVLGTGAGNFITRLTVVVAALFMLLSATLAYLSSSSEKSLQRASEAVRMREEARDVGTSSGAATPEPAGQSLPEGEGAEEAAEPEAADVAPSTGEAAEGAAEGAEAAPAEEAPAEEAAQPAAAPNEPATEGDSPAAPAAPAEDEAAAEAPSGTPTPAQPTPAAPAAPQAPAPAAPAAPAP